MSVPAEVAERPAAVPPRRGTRRAEQAGLTRLARRTARGGGWRHLLVVALIALAVAVAVAAAIMARTSEPTAEQQVLARFGGADLRIEWWQGEPSFTDLPPALQSFVRLHGLPVVESGVDVPELVRAALTGTEMLEIAYVPILVRGEPAEVVLTDAAHPLARGLFAIDGALPGPGEALLAPRIAAALDATTGDTVELRGLGRVRMTGTVRDPLSSFRHLVLVAPGTPVEGHRSRIAWLAGMHGELSEAEGAAEVRRRLEALQPPSNGRVEPPGVPVEVESREAALRASAGPPMNLTEEPAFVGLLVGGVLLVQVAFVAAGAFATGMRRRLREIGLLGAVGADPAQVRGLVLREALVLGVLGGTAGAVLGLGLAWLGQPLIERFSGRPVSGLAVLPRDLLGPALLGTLAALAAASMPARTASRVPVATALAGRTPLGRLPRWLAPAAVCTSAAGLLTLTLVMRADISGVDRELLVLGGVALSVGGAAALGAPLLALFGRFADRLPASARLALRDTVRQRTRSASAVAALTVVVIVPVVLAVHANEGAGGPVPELRRDLVSVGGPWYAGHRLPPTEPMVRDVAATLPPVVERATLPMFGGSGPGHAGVMVTPGGAGGAPPPPQPLFGAMAGLATPEVLSMLGLGNLAVELGRPVAVLLERGAAAYPGATHLPERGPARLSPADSMESVEVELVVGTAVRGTWDMPGLLLSPPLAEQLGLHRLGGMELLRTERVLTGPEGDRLWNVGQRGSPTFSVSPPAQRYGGSREVGWWAVGVAVAVALLITLMTAALTATESDHDLELITAVGGHPRQRRVFHGLQAAYHALLAVLLGLPAGLLVARAATRNPAMLPPVPWDQLTLLALGLPLASGVVLAVCMRSSPVRAPRRIT